MVCGAGFVGYGAWLGGLAIDRTGKIIAGSGLALIAVGNMLLTGIAAKAVIAVGVGGIFVGMSRGFRSGMRQVLLARNN